MVYPYRIDPEEARLVITFLVVALVYLFAIGQVGAARR